MKFHCIFCGNGIESGNDSPGTLVACSRCGAEVSVPQMDVTTPAELQRRQRANPALSRQNLGRQFRRMFLVGLIGCFVVGAVTAILAILSFDMGEFQARILLTTFSLGVYSVTGLACAVLADKSHFGLVGKIGVAVSIAGAVFAILTNWEIVTGWEILIKGRFSFLIVAIAFGHASLLLIIETTHWLVRLVRSITLAIIALTAGFLLATTMNPEALAGSWVILGILGVLDVLGTAATPLMHWATRESTPG